MPIYADEMPVEDLRKLAKYHVCAECGEFLRLSWDNDRNCYKLICSRFEEHNGIRQLERDLETQEINARLRGGPEIMETEALKRMDETTMLTRMDQARFPRDLTEADRHLMAIVSIEYGLDPIFDELMIYQGKPYVTISALRRKAQETDKLDGINARPATKEEKRSRRIPDEDYLFFAQVWVKGASHPFEGVGRVKASETQGDEHLPIVKDPAAQCEKRAEAQALRRAFHLPLPSFEELVEGMFKEVTPKKEALKSKTSPLKPATKPVAPPPTNQLTPAQRTKIWGDATKMGYEERDIHGIIKDKWGVESVNDLTVPQASTLIDMIGKGVKPPASSPPPPRDDPGSL